MRLYERGKNVTFVPHDRGCLRVWDWPMAGARYVVGVDPSEGRHKNIAAVKRGMGGGGAGVGSDDATDRRRPDYSAAIILNADSGQHVATWCGYIPPPEFAGVVAALGLHWNTAQLIVEVNNCGHAVLQVLCDQIQYPNLYIDKLWNRTLDERLTSNVGWRTTHSSRQILMTRIHEWLSEAPLTRDASLVKELRTMQFDPQGKPCAMHNDKDDRVMALGMALQARYEMNMGGLGTENRSPQSDLPAYDSKVWSNWKQKLEDDRVFRGGRSLRPRQRAGWGGGGRRFGR